MDVWEEVRQERLDLADRLTGLTVEQWDRPSLCTAWRIRDVLGHVTAGAEGRYGLGPVLGGLVRHGFNFNRWMAADGRRRGQPDPLVTCAALRAAADRRTTPPGMPKVAMLADTLIHAQDIHRPLGVRRAIPEGHLRPVADFLTNVSGFGGKQRLAGLRLVAVDLDWTHGQGPEVTGPAEALVMVMAGRPAGLDDLEGEGMATLRTRCS